MNEKRTTKPTSKSDVPYSPRNKTSTMKFWKNATAHQGVAELRAKRQEHHCCGLTRTFAEPTTTRGA